MQRILETIGPIVVGLLMSVAMAVTAQAAPAHFKADTNGEAIYAASQDEGGEMEFETEFGVVNCDIFKASGTNKNTTQAMTLGSVKYESDYFAPPSTACEGFGLEAEVEFNECDYVLHPGTYTGGGTSKGTVDLECPKGKAVVIDAGGVCFVAIPAQTGLGTVTYKEVAGAHKTITATAEIAKIAYEGLGLLCNGQFNNGFYDGKTTIEAFTDDGNVLPVDATIVEG